MEQYKNNNNITDTLKYLSNKYSEDDEKNILIKYIFDPNEDFSFLYDYILEFFKCYNGDNSFVEFGIFENIQYDSYKSNIHYTFYFDGILHCNYFFHDNFNVVKAKNLFNAGIDIFNEKDYFPTNLFTKNGCINCKISFDSHIDKIFCKWTKSISLFKFAKLYEEIYQEKCFDFQDAFSIYKKFKPNKHVNMTMLYRKKGRYPNNRKTINTNYKNIRLSKWDKNINTLEKYEKRQKFLNF